MTGPFNAGEAALTGGVTTVAGSTFCLSGPTGDFTPCAPHGLFLADARVLSRWDLRLDGRPAEPLSVQQPEAFLTTFVLRLSQSLLLTRTRLVADGMRETIRIDNFGPRAATVTVDLHVDADFADLFSVKHGQARHDAVPIASTTTENGLALLGRDRGVSVTGGPAGAPGTLSWHVTVPPRGRWETEVTVLASAGGRTVPPGFAEPARRLRTWRAANTAIAATDPRLATVLRRTENDLGALRIDGFVAAGAPWFMTLFGRDSLLTAWMALPLDPALALDTLRTLAESQGTRTDPFTEEQPGRIVHELRRGPDSTALLGGSHYFGTADATPLFVMLLAEAWRWGTDEQAIRALLPNADAALSWLDGHGDFVTYRRSTDRGLVNQGWKDSPDAINDAGGGLATAPIALCEVQGYAYAAWLARAELAEAFGGDADGPRKKAETLRERFAEAFWLPDRGWYAVALDGARRPVDALTSNTAHCLWTGIATDEHATVLIDHLSELDSGFGLRTLAPAMGAYNPMSYHNGSVWPHDTAIAVAGLLRYGHLPGAVDLAHRLAQGLLDAATAFGGRLPELYCGFSRAEFDPPVPFPTACSPQAWASAAPLLLVRALLGLEPHVPRGTLTVDPRLPAGWGEITLAGLRLGAVTITTGSDRAPGLGDLPA
jgi:glycogen debranching enzyme